MSGARVDRAEGVAGLGRLGRLVVPGVVVVAAALVCGPLLLGRGYALLGDMTFVPEQPWKAAWLGLDGSAPRAVPADALVSVLGQVIAGDLLQKLILLGSLIFAGLGMARLVARHLGASGRAAQAAAAVLYLWNPYVHERLGIGHWGLVLGYAALPWVFLAAGAVRRGEPGAPARLVLALAPAALGSPTGGLLAGLVALVVTLAPGRARVVLARTAAAVGAVVTVNLPWLVPGLAGVTTSADPAGVEEFAARADTPLGLWGSLATLGGIWKRSIVATERDAWLLVLLGLAVTVASVAALVLRARRAQPVDQEPGISVRLLVLAVLGLALAGLPATGPGADLVATMVEHVPGAGILRDSQKWIALLALAVAAGFALVVETVATNLSRRGLPGLPFRIGLVALPVVLLPSLGWGLAGELDPVAYPDEWAQVRTILSDQPDDQLRTVVLPFSAYQRLGWNDGRAALDPAIRYFPGQVVTSDELVLGEGIRVAGDNADAARIADAVRSGEPLAPVLSRTGVRFVLVERTAAGGSQVAELPGELLHDGPELRLVDLGNRVRLATAEHPALIVAGDVLAGLIVLVSGGFLAVKRVRHKMPVIG